MCGAPTGAIATIATLLTTSAFTTTLTANIDVRQATGQLKDIDFDVCTVTPIVSISVAGGARLAIATELPEEE